MYICDLCVLLFGCKICVGFLLPPHPTVLVSLLRANSVSSLVSIGKGTVRPKRNKRFKCTGKPARNNDMNVLESAATLCLREMRVEEWGGGSLCDARGFVSVCVCV